MSTIGGVQVTSGDELPPDYGRWLIHGPQGSGKTTLASTLGEIGPTLFIDLVGEHGTKSFQGAAYAKNIRIARPGTVTALDDIYWDLAKGGHPYKCVVIDSLTAVQKLTMRFLQGHSETAVREIRQGTAPADMRTWGQALEVMQDVAMYFFGLADGQRDHPMHVAMTAQTKITEDEEKNTIRTPDVQKGALSITLAAPDYILYTDVEDNLDADEEAGEPLVRHIVRFGSDPEFRIKARVPVNRRGRVPAILGRKNPTSLATLSRVLGVGGIPAKAAKKAAAAPTNTKEQ